MSSKLSNKKQVKQQISKSDVDFYKMSSLFFILCAVVLFIIKIAETAAIRTSVGTNYAYMLYNLFRNPVYITVIAVLLAASVIWFIVNKITRKNESRRVVSSLNCVAVMLYVAGFSYYYGETGRTTKQDFYVAIAITLGLALLYYISKIFNADFTAFSCENALFAVLMYKYASTTGLNSIIGKILLIVAFALVGYVVGVKSVPKSRARSGKQRKMFMLPYYISLAIWGVLMFVPGIQADLKLSVLLVQYIVFAIVYTIKLIRE